MSSIEDIPEATHNLRASLGVLEAAARSYESFGAFIEEINRLSDGQNHNAVLATAQIAADAFSNSRDLAFWPLLSIFRVHMVRRDPEYAMAAASKLISNFAHPAPAIHALIDTTYLLVQFNMFSDARALTETALKKIASDSTFEAFKYSGPLSKLQHFMLGLDLHSAEAVMFRSEPELGGDEITSFLGEKKIDLPPPVLSNYVINIIGRAREEATYSSDVPCRRWRNARVMRVGDQLLMQDEHGRIYNGVMQRASRIIEESAVRAMAQRPEKRVSGKTLCIVDEFTTAPNYAHWLTDWLARIGMAEMTNIAFDHVLGIWPAQDDFVRSSLMRILGDSARYFAPDESSVYLLDELLYFYSVQPDLAHPIRHGNPQLLDWLLQKLRPGSRLAKQSRRLYVPRRYSRRFFNDHEVWDLLQAYGFERVDTDALSFSQQIELFSEASAVIGPHGAQMTNMIFAPPGCNILECFMPVGGSVTFYMLAARLKHRYSCYVDYVEGLTDKTDSVTGAYAQNADFTLNISFLRAWLGTLDPI